MMWFEDGLDWRVSKFLSKTLSKGPYQRFRVPLRVDPGSARV